MLGLDWSEIHEEAEQLEHAISDRVLERIDTLLGQPTVDPHDNPIFTAESELRGQKFNRLVDCQSNQWAHHSGARSASIFFEVLRALWTDAGY